MKYRTKNRIISSMDSVKSAISSYNSPYGEHRFSDYTILMIIGWNRLFQAYFIEKNISYFYMNEKNTRYIYVDNTKKTWNISDSMSYFKENNMISESACKNLELFIKIRNRVEHNSIKDTFLMEATFGEAQALLYNYEKILLNLFDNYYSLNESLRFSLQFSTLFHEDSLKSIKNMMSQEAASLYQFICNYRDVVGEKTANDFDFSVKLIQMPDVSNTNSNDIAISFIKPETENDYERLKRITTLIKEKKVLKPIINTMKPSTVAEHINEKIPEMNMNTHYMKYITYPLGLRPYKSQITAGTHSKQDVNERYCVYFSDYGNYSFKETIFPLIYKIYRIHGDNWFEKFKGHYHEKVVLDINQYE